MSERCGICNQVAVFTVVVEDSRDHGFWSGNYCKKHIHFKLKQISSEIQHIPENRVLEMRGISKDGKKPLAERKTRRDNS